MTKINTKLAILAISPLLISTPLSADEWVYKLEPYIMLTSINGDAGVGRVANVDVDVNFDTILDNLDSAAMIHFEAHHNSGWGVVFDYGYMDLSHKQSNDNGSNAGASVRQGVLELQALYRTQVDSGYLDYFAGVRWWDNDIELNINIDGLPNDGFNREVKPNWIDPVIGVRWITNIDEKWAFLAQADIGGFGVGADFTSSLQTGVHYKISDLMTLAVKYKATWVDYDEGEKGQPGYFKYDTVTHGPFIGLAFNF